MSSAVSLPLQAEEGESFADYLQRVLHERQQQGLYRTLKATPTGCISFCDNDYLGLAQDERIREYAAQYTTGGAASRLVSGNHPLYGELETLLAQMKQSEAALVFASGFAMNSGVIPALAGKEDVIIADRLCHASLIDGIRASGASFQRFAHNDMAALERLLQKHRAAARHAFVVTETIFSMDGDAAPMSELLGLVERYDAQLIADDAHGFGVVSSVLKAHPRLIQLGTLSKAVGSLGGYLYASQLVVDYLVNQCRSLIYTTALPPMVLAASIKALQLMQEEPQRAQQARRHAADFCTALALPAPQAAIVPLIIGDEQATLTAAESLEKKGFHVAAIRPPTVPAGTARLRFTFSARHSDEQVAALIAAVKEVLA